MSEPVVAADGLTYERAAIAKWLKTHAVSPMTNEPLEHKHLTKNQAVRSLIAEWRDGEGAALLARSKERERKAAAVEDTVREDPTMLMECARVNGWSTAYTDRILKEHGHLPNSQLKMALKVHKDMHFSKAREERVQKKKQSGSNKKKSKDEKKTAKEAKEAKAAKKAEEGKLGKFEPTSTLEQRQTQIVTDLCHPPYCSIADAKLAFTKLFKSAEALAVGSNATEKSAFNVNKYLESIQTLVRM